MRRLTLLALVLLFGYWVTPARSQMRVTYECMDWISNRIAYGTDDGRVIIVDSDTERVIAGYQVSFPSDRILQVRWHPDGRYIAVGTISTSRIFILDTETGGIARYEKTYREAEYTSTITLAWKPDGTQLAVAGRCHLNCYYAQVWDWPEGTMRTVYYTGWISGSPFLMTLAWNQDGTQLATSNYNEDVVISDTTTWDAYVLHSRVQQVMEVAWQPNGNLLAVEHAVPDLGFVTVVTLYDVTSGESRVTIPTARGSDISWSPNGHLLAILDGYYNYQRIRIIDPETGTTLYAWNTTWHIGRNSLIWEIAWSPDETRIAHTGYSDEDLMLNLPPNVIAH
jgi:WD40 repeat protein